MFEKSRQSNFGVVAYSTNCDTRYLLSMRLITGFFAKYNNVAIHDRVDALEIDVPKQ